MNRYDRQIRVPQIGTAGQKKIQSAELLIVGCGALGSYAAEQLVRAGVKTLHLIDPDYVDESNLQRQTLFTTADAENKRAKVVAAQEKLQAINSAVTIKSYQKHFDPLVFEDFAAVDFVLDCTDNFLVRSFINDFCLHYHKPFIFASCAGTSGQVMALDPTTGPCLSCVFPNLKELEAQNCETLGVMTPLIPFVSSIQISLAFQLMVQPEKIDWQTLYVLEAWSIAINQFKIKKNPSCPVCSLPAKRKNNEESSLTKSCGGIFQAHFAEINLDLLETYAQEHSLPYKKNAVALQLKVSGHAVTAFKNGRLLFYGFNASSEVAPYFESFKNLLQ